MLCVVRCWKCNGSGGDSLGSHVAMWGFGTQFIKPRVAKITKSSSKYTCVYDRWFYVNTFQDVQLVTLKTFWIYHKVICHRINSFWQVWIWGMQGYEWAGAALSQQIHRVPILTIDYDSVIHPGMLEARRRTKSSVVIVIMKNITYFFGQPQHKQRKNIS